MNAGSQLGAEDWLTQFLDFTDEIPSPDRFRLWSGISAIAGVLERKVWARVSGKILFAHQFTVLVGPPGSGKTFVTDVVEEMWRSTKEHHVAPKSMSYASLGDVLKDSVRKIVRPGFQPPYEEFNSLLIHCRELKVLVPEYSSQMLDRLTDLWDCKVWDERLRGGGVNYSIEKPQVHILAGETPSWFNSMIPDNAWEGGFLSRTVLVYAGEQRKTNLFLDTTLDPAKQKKLEESLKKKGGLFGKMEFTPEAAEAVQTWFSSGGQPQPEHPKLRHYISRRHIHLIKLMMVSSISRTHSLRIDKIDFDRAVAWLLDAEENIEEIFKLAATAGDGKVIEDAWYFMYREYNKNQIPIRAQVLSRFVAARVPSHSVERVIKVMQESGYVKQVLKDGAYCYIPLLRHGAG